LIKYFVSADQDLRYELYQHFPAADLLFLDGKTVHLNDVFSLSLQEKGLGDWLLLSLSDVLWVSPGSSFGSSAALYGNHIPWTTDYRYNRACARTEIWNGPGIRDQPRFAVFP
jgi:hypothetical protein